MFCYYCGKENRDGASFCAYCGKALGAKKADAQKTVQVVPPVRNAPVQPPKPERKIPAQEYADLQIPAGQPKPNSKSFGRKVGNFFLKLLIWLLVLAILAGGVSFALAYFEVVEIPVISDILAGRDAPAKDDEDTPNREEEDPEEEEEASAEAPEETDPPTEAPTEDPAEAAYRNAEAHCQELAAAGNFEEAVQYLEECAAQENADARYAALLAEYQQLLKDNILSVAENCAFAGQYRLAIETAEAAWKQYADQDYYEAAVAYRREFGIYNTAFFAAGKYNTMLLRADGSVEISGDDDNGELMANYWTDITAVSAGDRHVVGLRKDGTVVAAGEQTYGQCNVAGWQNVAAISAGDLHTVGLLENGTIVAVGYNHFNQCDVSSLMASAGQQRIVSVAAGYVHTLALLENGRVVACGDDSNGACNVSGWTDIIAIYAGTEFSAGLRADGTVVATGLGTSGWDLSGWTDIVNLSAGDYYLVGLKADGTVLSVGANSSKNPARGQTNVSGWSGIEFIAAGNDHTVALNSYGEILCVGSNSYGQCGYSGTKLYG